MGRLLPKRAPIHKPFQAQGRKHKVAEPSRQARRTYATNSATWRAIRAGQLAIEPLCRICNAKGITRAASVVDHIDGDATNDESMNHQSLCGPCHSRKTAKEDGGFGNRKAKAIVP